MSALPVIPAPLACRYLLVIHIPLLIDRQGRRWVERLWAVDLARHTDYIRDLTVACPFEHVDEIPADCVPAPEAGLRFERIAWPYRALTSLLRTPLTLWELWRLIGRYDLVHSIYGRWWPFHTQYLVDWVAYVRRRCLMVIVESSDWRPARGEALTPWRRLKVRAGEALNRLTLSWADLAVFTHEGYRSDLMPRDASRGHVIHASWIDAAVVLSPEDARARWRQRAGTLRLLFAGRLQDDKGVRVLLEALKALRTAGDTAVHVSIIGAGPLQPLCREAAALSDGRVRVELLDPVPYGEAFFALLRGYDAVLVPSLADEQPRIVYDAYSQAVPVLASNTPGLATCVREGVTGHLFPANDVQALAEALRRPARSPQALEPLGLAALDAARSMTHQEMHRQRHVLIAAALAARGLA